MKKLSLVFTLVLFAVSITLAQRTISGMITDTSGEALIGANILAKGTVIGTVTDIEGKYNLSVPAESSVLVVSYTGYETQEITMGASNILDISMSEGLKLKEIVVTALGIEREKKALGYAVTTVSGEDVAQKGDADELLQGKVTGVNITSSKWCI